MTDHPEGTQMPISSDEDTLRDLLQLATADLHAPDRRDRPSTPLTLVPGGGAHRPAAGGGGRAPRRLRPYRGLIGGAAAAAVVAAVVVASPGSHPAPAPRAGGPATSLVPGTGPTPAPASGPAVLIELASVSKAVPVPPGRYAVQVERQTEGATSYTKATVADSRTGDVWTYQRGRGVPTSLPMTPHLLPTADELAAMPTDPAALRATLLAGAGSDGSTSGRPADAVVFEQAVQDLWNPLLEPPQRAALLAVVAATPGVTVVAHTTDATGRPAVETSFDDTATHQITVEYLDPATGYVEELAFAADATATGPGPAQGSDVFLSLTRTDGPPTVDPLGSAPADGTGAPGTTPATTPAPAPATTWFLSPSGNISCEIDTGSADQAVCLMTSPAQSATLSSAGVLSVCTGVSCLGNPPAGSPTLAYGSSRDAGPFRCQSAPAGITCTAAGKGFRISASGVVAVP